MKIHGFRRDAAILAGNEKRLVDQIEKANNNTKVIHQVDATAKKTRKKQEEKEV